MFNILGPGKIYVDKMTPEIEKLGYVHSHGRVYIIPMPECVHSGEERIVLRCGKEVTNPICMKYGFGISPSICKECQENGRHT